MYCKAGFQHISLEDCDHVVTAQFNPVATRASIIPNDFYSEEATARRREENRKKYQPMRRRYHQESKLAGNEAKEMMDWK